MSVSYDISTDPVFPLGFEPSTSSSLWSNTGFNYEWAVAGKPFLSIASDEFQSIRSFVQVNKQQFDNKNDPGEQTLTGWWLRSQRDFGCGAGQTFLEPTQLNDNDSDARFLRKFQSSYGVNVWTAGQITLLPSMSRVITSTGDAEAVSASDGTNTYIYGLTGSVVQRWNGTTTTNITGWTSTPTHLATTGNAVLGFHSTGIDISNSSGTTATSLWSHTLGVGDGWFVKDRIIAAWDSDLYELSLAGGTITAGDKIFDATGTTNSITWVSATAAPSAILVAGNRGLQGIIYRFTVADTGATTDLSAPFTVAEFPPGETLRSIQSYLGAYLLIVTSAGVRIGTIGADGSINYGPLTYSGTAQGHPTASDRFFYVGVADAGDGFAGCIRIDLSEIDQTGRAAWANDVSTGVTGEVDAVLLYGTTGRVAVSVHGQGIYVSSATELRSSGVLVTSRVRYSTLEPKTFQLANIRGDFSNGSVAISQVDVNSSETSLYTFTAGLQSEFAFATTTPTEFMSLKFTLSRSATDSTKGPTVRGWQIKALPAVTRKQQWRLPLLCFDMEQDRFGNRYGHVGGAFERYQALRSALLSGVPQPLQDLVCGETYTVLVEDVEFYQTSPPHNASGFGGVLIVQCREL